MDLTSNASTRSQLETEQEFVCTALALALGHVTYQHASLFPDASPRAVTFLVTDVAGSSSRPTVAVVNIIRAWLRHAALSVCAAPDKAFGTQL